MSSDEEPEGRQLTVAELLKQYGDGGRGASRRRRRAADDEPNDDDRPRDDRPRDDRPREDRPNQDRTIDRRSNDEPEGGERAGRAAPADPDRPRRSAHAGAESAPGSVGSTTGAAVPHQRWASGPGLGQSVDPLTGEPIDPPDRARPGVPPAGRGRDLRVDPPTEQLPRYPDAGPLTGPLTGPVTGSLAWGTAGDRRDLDDDGPPTGQLPRADHDLAPGGGADLAGDAAGDGESAGREPDPRSGGRRTRGRAPGRDVDVASPLSGAAPAGLAERDDRGGFTDRAEGADAALGVVGWLKLIGQWLVGALLGALLWVGFFWLWTNHPVGALVAAVLATAGLVLLVRAMRRSDDLQTTMLAVLVGVVVTISPAVLLLANR